VKLYFYVVWGESMRNMCELLMEEIRGEWETCHIIRQTKYTNMTVFYVLYLEYFANCIEEVWGWRKVHNEELNNFYQIKENQMGGACSMHGDYVKWLQNFSWKTWMEAICRWEDYIKIHHKELTYRSVHWIQLPQVRIPWCTLVKNMVMTLLVW
jgi:hypothetical protein